MDVALAGWVVGDGEWGMRVSGRALVVEGRGLGVVGVVLDEVVSMAARCYVWQWCSVVGYGLSRRLLEGDGQPFLTIFRIYEDFFHFFHECMTWHGFSFGYERCKVLLGTTSQER